MGPALPIKSSSVTFNPMTFSSTDSATKSKDVKLVGVTKAQCSYDEFTFEIEGRKQSGNAAVTNRRNQYYAAIATNMLALSFGTMFAWSGTAWEGIKASDNIEHPKADEESWIGSIIILGALLSGFVTGGLIEKYGRRTVMLALTIPSICGWGTIYFANSFCMIYIGRLLTGFAGGASALVVPIYIAEISDPDIRGTLLAGFDFGIAGGFLYMAILGSFLSWQMQVVACAILVLIGHALILIIPESPRYLLSQGDSAGALDSIAWFHRLPPYAPTLESLMHEFVGVVEERDRRRNLSNCASNFSGWTKLFRPEILKPCSVTLMIHLLSSFSAEMPISAYTVEIFESTATSLNAYHATIIFGCIDAVSAVLAALIVDRFGRRPLLLFSQVAMALSLASTGLSFWLKDCNGGVAISELNWLPVTSLGIFVFAFSIGTGPISYMITGEILPPEAKGVVAGFVNTVKWSSGFIVTKYFLALMDLWGQCVGYWILAGIALSGAFYVYACVPETRGKSLEEIQLIYAPKRKEVSKSCS